MTRASQQQMVKRQRRRPQRRQMIFYMVVVVILLLGGYSSAPYYCHAWNLPWRRHNNNNHSGGSRTNNSHHHSSNTNNKGGKATPNHPSPASAVHGQNDVVPSMATTTTPTAASSGLAGAVTASITSIQNALRTDRTLKFILDQFMAILLYNPPVGIVAFYTVTRLIWTGRIWKWYPDDYDYQQGGDAGGGDKNNKNKNKNSVQAILQKQQTKAADASMSSSTNHRPFVLDADDVTYRRLGGVDYVRQKLIQAALHPYKQQQQQQQLTDAQNELLGHLSTGMAVASPAGCSRRRYVQDMIGPLSHMQALTMEQNQKNKDDDEEERMETMRRQASKTKTTTTTSASPPSTASATTIDTLLNIGVKSAHIRTMDALLRVCRDRLLRSSYRLAHTVDHWNRRVESSRWFGSQQQLDQDRLRLAYAKAAYHAEVTRLGMLAQMLQSRPPDMPEQALLDALQASHSLKQQEQQQQQQLSEQAKEGDDKKNVNNGTWFGRRSNPKKDRSWWKGTRKNEQGQSMADIAQAEANLDDQQQGSAWKRRSLKYIRDFKFPVLSKYSFQWMAAGRLLSIRKLENNGQIHGRAATDALLWNSSHEHWLLQASEWERDSRSVVCHVLLESLKGSSSGSGFDQEEFDKLQTHWLEEACWCDSQNYPRDDPKIRKDPSDIAQDWARILQFVDSLPSWRRLGEGRALKFRDNAIVDWTRRINVLGLPVVALQIYLAHCIHVWIKPFWPQLQNDATNAFLKMLEILNQRAWIPLQGIYDEIMNRSKGIMSGFGLRLEERSLDHMLRDLGFGDGTAASRQAALEKAATQYEKDLAQGLLMNMASGRLIRLLLVQVQQLKVGLLSALETIDVLIKGNQIHFQILAAIPAVLLGTYGTKLFVRSLYNIRAKDLRPVNAAHVEMSTYLHKLECLVLELSTHGTPVEEGSSSPSSSTSPKSALIGEALFYVHRYLILLDFSSMSVPTRASEEIHHSLLRLMETLLPRATSRDDDDGLLLARNMKWVQVVKECNEKLRQYF